MARLPVLIVGGGPVGLTLGIDLAHRGVSSLLVEEREGPTDHPKATLLGARSMELFRRWGLDEAVYRACIQQQDAYNIVFCDQLAGHELHRFQSPASERIRTRDPETMARFRELAWSPYGKTQIGQAALEPVLLEHARTLAPLEMRHGVRFVSYQAKSDHVEAVIEHVTSGERSTICAEHLVACDGGGGGIRRGLGIRTLGRGRMRSNVSFLFRSAEFLETHGKGLANLYFCFNPGSFGVFTAVNGADLWSYQYYWADPTRDGGMDNAETILHRAMGRPFAFELLHTTHWHHHQSVATHWRRDRVFLAGDAAHLFVPTGGVGMNTGIGDAADLAWKLAAVHQGWAGSNLLDSYEAERKPVAIRNSVASANNSDRIDMVIAETPDDIGTSELARVALRERIKWMAKQFNSAGLHLGYRYGDSPLVVSDGTSEPPDDPNQLSPSTWPGCRAPHAWLPDGRSTLDLQGPGFTLLSCGSVLGAPRLRAAFEAAHIPLSEATITDPEAARLYAYPLILVRPDGHVAWRGSEDPVDPDTILDRVRGACSSVLPATMAA